MALNNHKQCGKTIRGAFTLVEVVVAAALMILALAMFMGTFVSSKRSAVIADNRMDAVQNARTVMETALSYKYDDPGLSNGLHWTTNATTPGVTSCYYVATVTQAPGNFTVKNIYLTNTWVNPGNIITSTISLAGSISYELHY